MADAFLGQIEMFAFDFPPKGWATCSGQIMPIAQNQALFALLGTTFGGDGITTFALPDLRGAAPMGQGSGIGLTPRTVGNALGSETVTLADLQNPTHIHQAAALSGQPLSSNTFTPDSTSLLAQTTGTDAGGNIIPFDIYAPNAVPDQPMASDTITNTGGQAHENRMPYLASNFCIAVVGIFPSRD